MTATISPPDSEVAQPDARVDPSPPAIPPQPPAGVDAAVVRRVSSTVVALSGSLASASSAWMVGGLFNQPLAARLIALLGVLIGGVGAGLALRSRRAAYALYALPLGAAVVGAALLAPDAHG